MRRNPGVFWPELKVQYIQQGNGIKKTKSMFTSDPNIDVSAVQEVSVLSK